MYNSYNVHSDNKEIKMTKEKCLKCGKPIHGGTLDNPVCTGAWIGDGTLGMCMECWRVFDSQYQGIIHSASPEDWNWLQEDLMLEFVAL